MCKFDEEYISTKKCDKNGNRWLVYAISKGYGYDVACDTHLPDLIGYFSQYAGKGKVFVEAIPCYKSNRKIERNKDCDEDGTQWNVYLCGSGEKGIHTCNTHLPKLIIELTEGISNKAVIVDHI